ncbi:unnamed protein product [Chrysodeixis includens]|uniref:Uncharacterized protein n=1 Tax=Chrysodeixis includens TaxID=689277 RepID=A0A9N8PZJ0_CHRIL|nr:unnamed protein product [Chrysodeixis includens]
MFGEVVLATHVSDGVPVQAEQIFTTRRGAATRGNTRHGAAWRGTARHGAAHATAPPHCSETNIMNISTWIFFYTSGLADIYPQLTYCSRDVARALSCSQPAGPSLVLGVVRWCRMLVTRAHLAAPRCRRA